MPAGSAHGYNALQSRPCPPGCSEGRPAPRADVISHGEHPAGERSRQPGRCPGPCEREGSRGPLRCRTVRCRAGRGGGRASCQEPRRSGAPPPAPGGASPCPGLRVFLSRYSQTKGGRPAVQGQPPKTAQCGQAFAAESWRGTTGPRLGGAARRGRQRWGGRPAPPWSSHTRRRSAGKLDSGEARLASNKTLGARGPGSGRAALVPTGAQARSGLRPLESPPPTQRVFPSGARVLLTQS